jgi:hypothetical protein
MSDDGSRSSAAQAVVFDKLSWNASMARKWLKKHKYTPIKRVDITTKSLRYRLMPPEIFKRLRYKKITPSISLLIGFY